MVDVLVFDMDDTLFPEEEYVFSGYDAVAAWIEEKHGMTGFAGRARQVYESGPKNRVFNEVLPDLGLPDDAQSIRELIDVYRNHTPKIRLFDDAAWALEHYSAQVPLGLISDGYLSAQRNKFKALEISHYFAKVVLTDELGRECWKPSPVPYQVIADALPAGINGYAYVGDNPHKDFIAPRQLGWRTVRVSRESGQYAATDRDPSHDADVLIRSLRDLPKALAKRN